LQIKKCKLRFIVLGIQKFKKLKTIRCQLHPFIHFQVDRYTGVWETVTTDDEENIPFGSECVTATYAKIAPNKISVNNSTPILPGPPGISTWAWGSALIVDESEPTELYVSFEMVNICTPQGCQSINFPNSTVTPYENYRVVDTDYDHYTVVVSCYNINETDHKEILYILVRDGDWALQHQSVLDEKVDMLTSLGLYTDDLWSVAQDDEKCGRMTSDELPGSPNSDLDPSDSAISVNISILTLFIICIFTL